MDITPLVPSGRQIIQGYGDGGFRISGTRHAGSVLIFPGRTLAWPVASVGDVTADLLALAAQSESPVEILLLGTGKIMELISPNLRHQFRERGIVIDVMDTGAACRTYNVLLSEDRRVAAALIAID